MHHSAYPDPLVTPLTVAADSDEDLMLRYRAGDEYAFEQLYARHKGPLYRYLLRQSKNTAVAEELFQDIWLNLIRARSRYTVQARFTTYLYRLAHNRLIDHYRAHARGVLALFEQADETLLESVPDAGERQPEAQLDRQQQAEHLLALLAELPAPQREAFLLREEAGLSLEEIAEATGTTRETAKSRLRYALTKLRRRLGVQT